MTRLPHDEVMLILTARWAEQDRLYEERAQDKCGDYRCPNKDVCPCWHWASERVQP